MSRETDPLLPKGNTAPEISGYGFSNPWATKNLDQNKISDQSQEDQDTLEEKTVEASGGFLPFRTIIAIFTTVVGLAIVITLLIPGALDNLWNKPTGDELTIKARVNKILSETPLIGRPNLVLLMDCKRSDRQHQMVTMILPF